MEDRSSYGPQWRNLRRRQWAAVLMFLGWIPYGATVSMLLSKLGFSENTILFFLAPYMIGFVVAGNWSMLFRCPRCNERFFVRSAGFFLRFHNTFARSCMNCGLPKCAPNDPGQKQLSEFEMQQPLFGKVFDVLSVPLLFVSVVTGVIATAVCTFPDLIKIEQPHHVLVIISVLTATDLILSMIAIISIRRKNLKQIIKESVPKWAQYVFPAFFILSFIAGIQTIFWREGRFQFPPPETQPFSNNTLPKPWMPIVNTIVGISVLSAARRIRTTAMSQLCANGHQFSIESASCPTCATFGHGAIIDG